MASKHMKRCSTALSIRGMQIKTLMINHHTPFKVAKMKSNSSSKFCQECKKLDHLRLLLRMKNKALENNLTALHKTQM